MHNNFVIYETEKLNKRGDINGDGKVNAVDVALINAHSKAVKSLWK